MVATSAGSVAGLVAAGPAFADQQPDVSINDITVTEGDSGTTSAVFTISLSQAVPVRTTITYNTVDGSARSPGDYTGTAGQLVFAPGTTSKTVAVDVLADTRYEGDEAFSMNIASPSGAIVSDNSGVATILDDDPAPYLAVGEASATEGDTGSTSMTFPITLDHASAETIRVRYSTSDGSAQAGVDYAYTRGTLVVPAGATTASVTVPVYGDTIDEGRFETFSLTLSNANGALLQYNPSATGTIFDDDDTSAMSVTDSAVVEGNSGTTNMVFKVSLSSPSPNPVTAYFATADGSAVAGSDYTPQYGTLSFPAGTVSKQITVPVKGDTITEGKGEYFLVYLQNVSGASVAESSASGQIVDDDGGVGRTSYLSVDTATVKEPNSGTVSETFHVLLQPAASVPVTVSYNTQDGSAVGGSDYTTTSGSVTIPAGSTSVNVVVPVKGDNLIENDEYYFLSLSNATGGAVISDGQGLGDIVENDVAPVVSVMSIAVPEGDTGTTADAAFELSLSSALPITSSVAYSTNDYSAVSPSDFTSTSGTATFQPGQTTKVIHVSVNGDTVDENDETFFVYLSGAQNVTILDNYATATIVDDDHTPGITANGTSLYEGTTGPSNSAIPVSLDAPSANTVTVNYSTQDGTATAPNDYTTISGTLTFAPGQTTATINVPVMSDSIDEGTEYFYVQLSAASYGYVHDSYSYHYILDDDSAPGISVADTSIVEPDSGSANLTFTALLTAPSLNTVTVNYSTLDGSAVSTSDYTTTSGTLTFNPGETSKTITVPVTGDTFAEPNEYLYLYLTAPTNAYVFDSYIYGTIFDNDPLPVLSTRQVGVVEGDSGTKNASVVVNLSPASPNTVTVNYSTLDGSATAGDNDYTPVSGTLTFAPGQRTKTVSVPVRGDTNPENNEYCYLYLTSPVNAGITYPYDPITIFNNDPSGGSGSILTADDTAVVETNTGTTNATFNVTISPAPTAPVTVNYATGGGNATPGADYVPQNGTLSFAAGQTSATVTVPVVGDTLDEANEYFNLSLFSPTGPVTLGNSNPSGTILNNDRSPVLAMGDAAVSEGNNGTVDASLTVSLSAPSPQPVYVDWDTRNGSATAPGDYLDDGGTLTFAPGQTNKTIHVTVNSDNLVEGDEVFYVDLSKEAGAYVGSSGRTGACWVLDSDSYPVLGAVTDTGGAGIAGTTLTLSGNQRPTVTTTSGTDGSFLFDNLIDGRYTLTATASGRTFAPATYTVDVRGAAVTGLTFISLTAPSISGRIVDSAGNPVMGATVTRSGNSQPDAVVTTNGMGYYGFTANPTGTYTVKPKLTGATFTPVSKTVTLTATTNATANFTKAGS